MADIRCELGLDDCPPQGDKHIYHPDNTYASICTNGTSGYVTNGNRTKSDVDDYECIEDVRKKLN